MNHEAPPDGAAPPMTAAEYHASIEAVGTALRIAEGGLRSIRLEVLEACLRRAEVLGPILDPTAWIRADRGRVLLAQVELLRWAAATRAALERVRSLLRVDDLELELAEEDGR